MMGIRRVVLYLWLLGLPWATLAQQSRGPSLPTCALECLFSAFSGNTCKATDQACICTNQKFQSNITLCVTNSCTIPEALVAKNYSMTQCGAPVRNKGPSYKVLSNTMVAVAGAFVVMRFAFKILVARSDIGYDDWFVLATMIMAIPCGVITVSGMVANGLGQNIWTLTPTQITDMLKYFYVMAILYFTEMMLQKLTMLFFYIRVFPTESVQRLLWGTIIFVITWGFTYITVAIFQCRPIPYFWTKWDGLHQGSATCLNINAVASSHAGFSIALDLWILGIPLWQVWGLRMHWKKKVGVIFMFCVGTFVTIVSMLRLRALVHFAASSNASWEFYDVSVWSTLEISVGIMCACLPTMRLLLVKLFPILDVSSAHSRGRDKYYNYGSGNEPNTVGGSNKPRNIQSNNPIDSLTTGDEGYNLNESIVVKKSYSVHRSRMDGDEISLVSQKSSCERNV